MTEIPTYDELANEERVREIAREVAREEIASLAGLVLRRSRDSDHVLETQGEATATRVLAEIFGEALADFTTDAEPGI